MKEVALCESRVGVFVSVYKVCLGEGEMVK